jgi:signal transduction histidine kinase
MLSLPRLSDGESVWHLPLSDGAAAELLRLHLTDDPDLRQQGFWHLLADDPVLALWCVCRTGQWQHVEPAGIQDLAGWLSQCGYRTLQWDDADLSLRDPIHQSRQTLWADWVAEAVVTARRTRRLAGSDTQERACLTALLHLAEQWLTSCLQRPVAEDGVSGASCLPAWLKDRLQQLRVPAPEHPVAAIVAQAIAWAETGAPSQDTAQGEADAAYVREVRDGWLRAAPETAALLPAAMRKLARLQELETRFQQTLEHAKLEALKALAYGASHEINNPLANISIRAQSLLRDEADPERRRKLAVINNQAFRAHEMIADLMLFAQPPELRLATIDLLAVVDRVVEEMQPEAADQGTQLSRVSPPERLTITADSEHLIIALKALCRNALEALRVGGQVELSAREVAAPADDPHGRSWVEIQVRDTGPGIPAEVQQHLFDPYFSGREAGRGLGLGLSKCWRVVTDHGGRIEVASAANAGATFTVRLPQQTRRPLTPPGLS